jgi:thiamine biosynthesis lipoprotein
MRKHLWIPLAALLVLAAAAAVYFFAPQWLGTKPELKRYKASFFDVFDTYSEVIVYAADEAAANEALNAAHAELQAYHRLYDIYNTYEGVNNLRSVNDSAGLRPVPVDTRLLDMFAFALDMDTRTQGRMNVAMGAVLRIWHDYRTEGIEDPENAALPTIAELNAANEHTDISDLVIDRAAGTLYLRDPQAWLDVGAVAKGYAVEQVAQALIARGVTSAILSIGGNVRAIGTRGDGTPWRVNVQNPDVTAENQSITTLSLRDVSLVTSGSYERFYTVDGKAYHHIIDPDTLMPAAYTWAVSVVTKDSGIADALSTALFTLSIEDGKALLAQFPGVEVLWVDLDGTIVRTDGFASLAGEEAGAA